MKNLRKLIRPYLSPNLKLFAHKLEAIHASLRYGFPARGMLIIGVTGTKGKTTTCHFIASILEEAGYTVGMATTVGFKIGECSWSNDFNMSVLPHLQFQKLIRDMRDAHCDALVIEVTSHALEQNRVWGLPFRYAGLTNITHDHLDYHKTWANYQAAKLKLFLGRDLRAMTVNADDPSASLFLEKTSAPRRWSYSTTQESVSPDATDHLFADHISTNPEGSSFTLKTEAESLRVQLQVPGRFNIENALCASALCLNLNLKLGTIAAGLEKMERVAGRLEKIPTRKGFSVMIDYAHTPDSLEKLYSALRPDIRGRLIAVLGATGDRDRTKRPIMGALAARFCDYVFITDEEPYTEDPQAIIEEIAKGVPRGRPLFKAASGKAQRAERPILKKGTDSGEGDWWWKITDRREAISRALDLCKMDDLVLVTGMGAQRYKTVGDQKVAWSDREVIEKLLVEKKLA